MGRKTAEVPGATDGKGNREAIHSSQISTKTTCSATNFELRSEHTMSFPECEFEEICTMEHGKSRLGIYRRGLVGGWNAWRGSVMKYRQ